MIIVAIVNYAKMKLMVSQASNITVNTQNTVMCQGSGKNWACSMWGLSPLVTQKVNNKPNKSGTDEKSVR